MLNLTFPIASLSFPPSLSLFLSHSNRVEERERERDTKTPFANLHSAYLALPDTLVLFFSFFIFFGVHSPHFLPYSYSHLFFLLLWYTFFFSFFGYC